MSLRVNTNIAAMNAYRNLNTTETNLGKNLEKLSSGLRINRAADDAAGLVNSEALRSQVRGMRIASRNAQDGISVAQTAEGALNEVTAILQRMRDLSVQRANSGANSTNASAAIDAEYAELANEITRIGEKTEFNGTALLTGASNFTFQVGAKAGDVVTLTLSGTGSVTVNATGLTLGTQATSIGAIDTAIATVSTLRAKFGAFQNRMEHTVANLGVAVENLSASESRIRDTDIAQEMTAQSKNSILSQAGTAMLAQANSAPQGVLSLLR